MPRLLCKTLLLAAGLASCLARSAAADSNFRFTSLTVDGADAVCEVVIRPEYAGHEKIDFYAHAGLCRHSGNCDATRPLLREGLKIKSFADIAVNSTVTRKIRVPLATLATIGVVPGKTLYLGAVFNFGGNNNGGEGHQWGPIGESESYTANVSQVLPEMATKNAAFGRSRAQCNGSWGDWRWPGRPLRWPAAFAKPWVVRR